MFNSRLFSIMRKEIIQMTRDRRTVIISFIQPILMLFLLGSAATSDVRNVPAALFDQDHSQAARDLLDHLLLLTLTLPTSGLEMPGALTV